MDVINKSALYKEYIHQYSKDTTYLRICLAVDGDLSPARLSPEEKKGLLEIIDAAVKQVKENIKKS